MSGQQTSQRPQFVMEMMLEAPAAEDGSHTEPQRANDQWQNEDKYYTRILQLPTSDSILPDKRGQNTSDMSPGTGSSVRFDHRTVGDTPCFERAAPRRV
jgi:hypothetical protein